MIRFADRKDAGNKLSRALKKYAGERTIIYALPRGGVVVGFVVAQALKAPLDLVITRKIGHPQNPEYAVCAITEAGELFCNEAEKAALDPIWLARQAEQEKQEARRRRKVYLGNTQPLSATDKIAIVVDDGIATGLTMRAALRSLRRERPKKLIAAIPVAPAETARALRRDADEVIVLQEDENYLGAVGAYYDDFSQT
ncbi:MAG TPA: phosphoribosyltransferase family protein, partial [Candidatus Methylomirabilis sp.]|nr:phosphoribosyltransferase family protein [Candidatus Methylomirabilis sp.]